MKLKLFTNPLSVLLALTLIVVSCAKTGPAGPAGATGPAGVAGPAGATGTANVIYSPWLNVAYKPGTSDNALWIARIAAPKLTDSILSMGEVKVYVNAGSDSAGAQFIIPLPINDPFALQDVINVYFSPQTITLASSYDESSFVSNKYNHYQYRYLLIPGGTKSGRYANVINWNDYQQVKKYLRLND